MRALVTGGAGFLGSHLCEFLLERGWEVECVDALWTGCRENIQHLMEHVGFSFWEWDVRKPFPEHFFSKKKIDVVFHLASPASPRFFESMPLAILETNALGTLHVLSVALEQGAHLVLASTSEVYGDPQEHPQKESYWGWVNPVGVRSCYDEGKRFAEAVVMTAIRGKASRGEKNYPPLSASIVRIFNTYGPRMRLDDGRVIPAFFQAALQGKALPILGSGFQTRSFCYVSDLIEGLFLCAEKSLTGVVNLGNPHEVTLLELADTLERVLGKKLDRAFLPAREEDPRKRCPDIQKARELLGWTPRVSLEEGLQKSLDFFEKKIKEKAF